MPRFFNFFVIFFNIVICFTVGSIEAQTGQLPKDEVEALREIAAQLGKKDWDFKLNPCDGNSNWSTPKSKDMPLYNNTLLCNCTFPDNLCHVESIFLKGQDLAGVLPASLAKLPYLKIIDLNRNYLSGTIPPEWASTKLELMAISNNRLSGHVPKYIGNMTSLVTLSLETNLFNGSLPAELGNLVNLQMLILSANNFTGEWPVELNNLTKLIELRISSNSFTGKLPNFESWKNLQMLEIEGSGFERPIPPSISALTSLTELRISNLNGDASEFPPLTNMTSMTKLVLRSCNIRGNIPRYVAEMIELRFLDLSFNKLEGGIANLEGLTNMEATYLTGNAFVGRIPDWIFGRDTRNVIDLSYNKFDESSEPSTCRDNLNLFRSFKAGNFIEHGKCLSISPCSEDKYSLHINCGGGRVTIGGTTYEEDEDSLGAAKFVYWKGNWGTSSTGHFWDRIISLNDHKAKNVSAIKGDESQLYMTAHLSPLALTYFGRCLANGSYTLTLHFAEIVYRDNQSFQSLGRRIFDIYVQDELKFKDFDIKRLAGGVDKPLKEKFNVTVRDKTLQMRFQYAGKGTTSIPTRGNYGPLISAISLEANFKPPPPQGTSSNKKKKILIVAGTLTSSLALILMIFFVAWRKRRNRKLMEQELRGLDLQTGIFTFRQIKAATSNFDAANKLGEGGFGSVYKGTLADGTIIAVKQLSSKSRQGNREFVNEIGMMSGLHHPNLVRLYGCCVERNQLLLVYEYMENNNLSHALFGPGDCRPKLDWPTRQKICVGIAKGLAFLHEESPLKMIHRDIKGTNVLLDKDLNPKISDFGLAKLHDEEKTHVTTRVAGTIGYMAPEYALWGYLTHKADLYSFGVVVLELVAGKNNMKYHPDENYVCLLDWALVLQKKGKLLELMDPRLDILIAVCSIVEKMGGSRAQVNKAHKTRFASKSSRNVHKVSAKDKSRIAKPDRNLTKGARAARLQRNKMVREQKRDALLKEKRASSGSNSPPKVIVLFGLSGSVDLSALEQDLLKQLSADRSGVVFPAVASSEYKLRATVLKAPHGDLLACMEMAKVADLIAFVTSASSSSEDDCYIDAFGSHCLSVFRALGLPSTAVLIRDLPSELKKKNDSKKACTSSLASEFPEDCKFYPADTKDDLHKFLWLFKEQRFSVPHWRNQRPYLMAQKVDMVADNSISGKCTLLLSGYVRARNLSVNQLVHITGAGDFQLSKIELLKDPCSLNVRKGVDLMDSDDMNEAQILSCLMPDPMKQEPLLVENDPDPLAGEQTWPTEAEMAEAERNQDNRKLKRKTLPKGTSEYQAAWIVEDSDADVSESENEEDDGMVLDEGENALNRQGRMDEFELDDDQASLSLESDEETETHSMMMDGENLTKEQMKDEIRKIKEAHAEDEEFPDEVDTPLDVPARMRFAKYRGLKSFRTSSWDPKESLPQEYARIFAFDNFNRTQKHVLSRAREMEQNIDECAPAGSYARLHVREVPIGVANKLNLVTKTMPVNLCGLMQHESKISVLHFSLKKHDSYTAPIKAKEEMIFNLGFRQFVARPIFSSDSFNADKQKMERFLHPGRFSVASIYAPISFPPLPLIAMKIQDDGTPATVAATGSLRSIDPDRIILKKIILTGYPQRVSKLKATVRYMFHNPEDVRWFKPVEVWSKCGRRGRIKEPVGTHGAMKCILNGVLQQHDTLCMSLFKRTYPKWPEKWFPMTDA